MNNIIPRQYDYAGVYMIENITNKKVYIGSSRDIENRLRTHRHALRNGTHHNKDMQEDFNRHHKFVARILYVEAAPRRTSFNRNRLYAMEYKFIEQYDAFNSGYNQLGMSDIVKNAI